MSWIFSPFRRTTVVSSNVQVKFFVMYSTNEGAIYVAYIKNTGTSNIQDASFSVTSQQPMKGFQGKWTVAGDNAVCDLGSLDVGQERAVSLDIAGNVSSAILVTTTNPPLADPNSGMAQASFKRQINAPEEVTLESLLIHARSL